LARAQQDAVWERQQAANKLRSLLREYYPSFLATFDDLASRTPARLWPWHPPHPRPEGCGGRRCGPR
jgi:hypothetical protein